MWVSSLKLAKKDFDVRMMVGTDSIKDPICGETALKHGLDYCGKSECEESELIYDLKTKYLDNFGQLAHIQPTSFKKACAGN